MSGYGDIAMAVQAIRAGAIDFLEKPIEPLRVVERVEIMLEELRLLRSDEAEDILATNFPGRAALTRREIEVLRELVAGATNKVVARNLGISPRTVEAHRHRLMEKLGVNTLAEMVRVAVTPLRS